MTNAPIEWYDEFSDGKERKVFTEHEHGIPGLRMFGHHNTTYAIDPLPLHYHKNSFEFAYIAQGNLRFFVDGHSYSLTGGDMFVTFPNEVHDTGDVPMSLHEIYWFQLEIQDPEHFLYMAPSAARCLMEKMQHLPHHVIKVKNTAGSILEEVFENITGGSQLGRIQAGQLLGVLLCQILKDSEEQAFRITPDIGRTTEYILEHIGENLEMEDLAKVATLSVSRFKEKFMRQLGTSPRNFINYHKVEQAKRMLQDGKTITQTAMELNFSSSNYFSTVFRRYTSLSPSEYVRRTSAREKHRG